MTADLAYEVVSLACLSFYGRPWTGVAETLATHITANAPDEIVDQVCVALALVDGASDPCDEMRPYPGLVAA